MNSQIKTDRTVAEQSIEELQQRYEKLNTRKIQAETNLENTQKQLDSLKKDAREKYGTDDVVKLREKLSAMKSENDEKRRNYQAELDRIEGELQSVEKKFAAAEDGSAAGEET